MRGKINCEEKNINCHAALDHSGRYFLLGKLNFGRKKRMKTNLYISERLHASEMRKTIEKYKNQDKQELRSLHTQKKLNSAFVFIVFYQKKFICNDV